MYGLTFDLSLSLNQLSTNKTVLVPAARVCSFFETPPKDPYPPPWE